MTDPILDAVVKSAARTFELGLRLAAGIPPEQFARLPTAADGPIRTNHPAFIYGHLALYPAKIMTICGVDPSGCAPPVGFEERFKRESPCHDDPEGKIYPQMETITTAFALCYRSLFEALPAVPPERFAMPNPDPRLAQVFTTVGFATVFLLCNHVATHLGQVSAWRRCMGLPPV
jgi:hypothetical protein